MGESISSLCHVWFLSPVSEVASIESVNGYKAWTLNCIPEFSCKAHSHAMCANYAAVSAGKFGQRTTSDIQRAYDAAPGPPTKGAVHDEGPPSAPPALGPSSGLNGCPCQLLSYVSHVLL